MSNNGICKREGCTKSRWYDRSAGKYSDYCSLGCRNAPKPYAEQGQPLCRICNAAAWYDTTRGTFSPGCGRRHADEAMKQGFTTARN